MAGRSKAWQQSWAVPEAGQLPLLPQVPQHLPVACSTPGSTCGMKSAAQQRQLSSMTSASQDRCTAEFRVQSPTQISHTGFQFRLETMHARRTPLACLPLKAHPAQHSAPPPSAAALMRARKPGSPAHAQAARTQGRAPPLHWPGCPAAPAQQWPVAQRARFL